MFGQTVADAATWGLLPEAPEYLGSDVIADAGNMWHGGNFGQNWDRLDYAVGSHGVIDLHSHSCPACGCVWAHGECNFGDCRAHTCPQCGSEQWVKDPFVLMDGDATDVVGAVFVSADEKNKMQSTIDTMTAEINGAASAARQSDASNAHELTEFQGKRWTPFVAEWNEYALGMAWMFDTEEYERLAMKLGQLKKEWVIQLEQKTSAPDVSPTAPSVADSLAKHAPVAGWVIVLALVGVGLLYIAPVLLPLVAAGSRK